MGPRLTGGHDPGSHPGAARAHAKHRCECAAVADPARRQYRQVKLAEHRLKQGQQRTVASDMPARFNALHGNKVAAGVSLGLGLIQRTDLPAGQRATAVRQFDQRRVTARTAGPQDPGRLAQRSVLGAGQQQCRARVWMAVPLE